MLRTPARSPWSRRARAARRRAEIAAAINGSQSGGKKVSLADLIVLGGCAGVAQAATTRGRTTATCAGQRWSISVRDLMCSVCPLAADADSGGVVRARHEGFREMDEPVIEAEVRALLAANPGEGNSGR